MGFQSCSRKMTVSAAVRFSPRPPTCTPGTDSCFSSGRHCMHGYGQSGVRMQQSAILCKSQQPTAVVSSMTSIVGSALKRCTRPKRRLVSTPPSRRSQLMPLGASTCPVPHQYDDV